MSEAKHTPGPWHTGTTESTKYTIYSQLGFCIANSFNGVFVDAACEANARLIAAAPGLLEALKEAVGGIVYLAEEANCNTAEWIEWHKRARAAIAKAEGGAA